MAVAVTFFKKLGAKKEPSLTPHFSSYSQQGYVMNWRKVLAGTPAVGVPFLYEIVSLLKEQSGS